MRIGFNLRTRMLGARLWPERMAADGGTVQSYEQAGTPSAVGWRKRLITALSGTLAAEQERWFPWSVAAFGAGIAAYFGLLAEPSWLIIGAIVVVCAVLAALGTITANTILRFACALLVASGLGFAAGKLRMARVDAPVIARDTGPKRITGRIENVEIRGANRARIVLATSTSKTAMHRRSACV